ncbi:MAG: HU family DNA-binding protein [Phycisphaerales bacterium]|nr:HU family DNA-binding protein [Phycisphaerales bacterium]
MTRTDLTNRIAHQTGLKPQVVKAVLDVTTHEVAEALARGEVVTWYGLGRLWRADRGGRPYGVTAVPTCALMERMDAADGGTT